MQKYDSKKGANKKTFAECIVHSKAIDLYRKGEAELRMLLGPEYDEYKISIKQ
jgi:DNA-directed RNA polymerase specialized sigma24 family protein